jgi:hypothetical protein
VSQKPFANAHPLRRDSFLEKTRKTGILSVHCYYLSYRCGTSSDSQTQLNNHYNEV